MPRLEPPASSGRLLNAQYAQGLNYAVVRALGLDPTNTYHRDYFEQRSVDALTNAGLDFSLFDGYLADAWDEDVSLGDVITILRGGPGQYAEFWATSPQRWRMNLRLLDMQKLYAEQFDGGPTI